jgi:Tol biopolymer transport system component
MNTPAKTIVTALPGIRLVIAVAAIGFLCCSMALGDGHWDGAKVTKTDLLAGETKHGKRVYSFASVMTRSGCHVVKVEGERWLEVFARRDGRRGKAYEDISPPVFSPDGTTLGYTAQSFDGARVVINDQEGPLFDEILPETFVFSHDGKRHAYLTSKAGRLDAVIDGVVQPGVDGDMQPWRQPPLFSADGSSVGYVAGSRLRKKMRVVINGKPGEPFDAVDSRSLRFSPDGRRFSCAANDLSKGDHWFCVIDGKRGKRFDGLGVSFAFSPDGKRFAYTGNRGPQWFLAMDGEPEVLIEGIVDHSLIFSPDSRRLAYAVAKLDQRAYLVVDGKEGPVHDRIGGSMPLGPANRASMQSGSGLEPGSSMSYNYTIAPGSPLLFSPDGRRIAYLARSGPQGMVYVDGKADGIKMETLVGGMLFSDDSKRLAYGGRCGNECFLVVDGLKGADYDALGNFGFSPDGKHIAFVAKHGDKLIIVVDGQERGKYESVPAGPVFRSDGVLEFLAADNSSLYRIEVSDL